MALDNANKRASAVMTGLPWRVSLPFPNGSISAADRAQTAFEYAGPSFLSDLMPKFEGFRRNVGKMLK